MHWTHNAWCLRCRLDGSFSKAFVEDLIACPTLLNDKIRLQKLLKSFPKVIGGEMEAWGLVQAYRTVQTSGNLFAWIVVKGICDWAYDKNKFNQPHAARAAADLVYQVLQKPEVLEQLRAWEVGNAFIPTRLL